MENISDELEQYVTKRLLDFYDGLLERGQIDPPIQRTISEGKCSEPTNLGRADSSL